MVEPKDDVLDRTFAALSDPTRRRILARLRTSEATISDLAGPFDMSFNAVSKHVKALEQAGLVRRRVQGREHYCALEPAPLRRATGWLDEYRVFWDERLDALDAFLRRKRANGRRPGSGITIGTRTEPDARGGRPFGRSLRNPPRRGRRPGARSGISRSQRGVLRRERARDERPALNPAERS